MADFAAARPLGEDETPPVRRFLEALVAADCPIVAAVQGNAVGVGMTMLLHCDHVVLADNARLLTPFVNLALVPEAGSSRLLPQRVGYLRAFSMLALGEPVTAPQALEWGLANRVVSIADLDAAAHDVARRLSAQPAGALSATKRLMRDRDAVLAHMAVEGHEFAARLQSAEAKEAFAAFAERRKPDFTRIAQGDRA